MKVAPSPPLTYVCSSMHLSAKKEAQACGQCTRPAPSRPLMQPWRASRDPLTADCHPHHSRPSPRLCLPLQEEDPVPSPGPRAGCLGREAVGASGSPLSPVWLSPCPDADARPHALFLGPALPRPRLGTFASQGPTRGLAHGGFVVNPGRGCFLGSIFLGPARGPQAKVTV